MFITSSNDMQQSIIELRFRSRILESRATLNFTL